MTPEPQQDDVLRSLIDSVGDLPVSVVIDRVELNSSGEVVGLRAVYVNPAGRKLFGPMLTHPDGPQDPSGTAATDVLDPDDAAESLAVAQRIWTTGASARGVWPMRVADTDVTVRFTRLKVEPCYLVGYFEDERGRVEAREQRSAQDDTLRAALDANPDGFLILDREAPTAWDTTVGIDYANPAVGTTIPEMSGAEVVDPSTDVGRAITDLLIQSRGIPSAVRGIWPIRSGSRTVTLAMSTKPLGDGRRVVTFRDVSAQEKVAQDLAESNALALSSRAMLFAALDSLPVPMAIAEWRPDSAGTDAFFVRFRNASALARSTETAHHRDGDIPVERAMPGLLEGGALDVMHEVMTEGGTRRIPITVAANEVTGREIHYDLIVSRVGPLSVILAGFDVTDLRLVQSDLEEARDSALAFAEERADFFAALTHELRTPLTTVVTAAELLTGTDLDPQQQELARQQVEASRHLLSVINDSLDLRGLSEGTTEFEHRPLSLRRVQESLDLVLRPLSQTQRTPVRWVVDGGVPEWILGDEFRLERVLLNLLTNALKFTEGGTVEVHVSGTHVRDDVWELRFDVTDSGDGIPEESLARIFEPFQQAKASTQRTHGGSGLGLALVKQLVERMNGRVWVTSVVGQGSTFSFTVRKHVASAAPADREAPARQARHEFTLARVLLVEDEDVNRMLVTALLEREGFIVDSVGNGVDAVTAALSGKYDVALMDVRMPVVSGYEATRRIRRSLRPDELPVIALTASPTPEVRVEALASGMQEVLGKPVDMTELIRVVSAVLGGQGADVP
jgi:signal transduction histidine kinase/ActR/RegA family two-component response regulator/PAS domain-containing protein